MNDLANYFAVIPANVRYDSTLNANAKLLYGEIAALCNKHGICWATNSYFAKLYNTTNVTISRWIKVLKEKGYISIEIVYKDDGKTIDRRNISIVKTPINKNDNGCSQECNEGINKNDNTPINKNVKENNTSMNNTSINTPYSPPKGEADFKDKFNLFWALYPRHDNKQKTIKWFEKNNPNDKLFKIMLDKIEQFKRTEQWQNKQFIPMPTTWLNGKRWEDEIISENTVSSNQNNQEDIYEEI